MWRFSLGEHELKVTSGNAIDEIGVEFKPHPSAVAVWEFDEGSGNIAHDLLGNMDLQIRNLVHWTNGKFRYGLKIDNSISTTCTNQNAGIYTNNIPNEIKNLPQKAFTISWWNKLLSNTGTTRLHLASVNVPGCGRCSIWNRLNMVEIRREENPSDSSTDLHYTPPSVNEWHYFVFYFDYPNRKARIYVDGKLEDEKTLPNGNYGTVTWFSIGVYHPNCVDSIPGAEFDQVMIFSQALTPDQIYWMEMI